jgi:NADPH:quinone reductase-like Zn-dependent oxidoreductase
LEELLEAGKVKHVIDRRYPLSEAAKALRNLEEGQARGKVAVTIEHNYARLLMPQNKTK